MKYHYDLDKVIQTIKEENANVVCIQLAEGLKMQAQQIQEELETKTGAHILIWMNSCFGACDVPDLSKVTPQIDLLVQFGHEFFIKTF